jgi:hypothetical protein
MLNLLPIVLLVVLVSLSAIYMLLLRIDSAPPIAEIAATLACLQWLVGPLWYYAGKYDVIVTNMAVSEIEYFAYAVPGTAAFCLGLLVMNLPITQRKLIARVRRNNFFMIGLVLNGVALVCDIVGRFAPDSLGFVFFLLTQLRYVGVLYLWFSPHAGSRWLATLCTLPLLASSAKSAMFHDLLLWSGMLFCFWFSGKSRTIRAKIAIIMFAALVALTVQGIKQSFRMKVWGGQQASLSEEVVSFWMNFSSSDKSGIFQSAMVRLNQGWIVSYVLAHVPEGEPFANGNTIKDAVIAAILPRIVYQDKTKAGGRVNFTRFTGLPIKENTSMNISLLGEGYANFGMLGGWIFLLITGIFIALTVWSCFKFTIQNPTFLFWVPLIFYQAVKAETDLTEILTQILKGGVLAFACYWLIEKTMPTEIFKFVRPSVAPNKNATRPARIASIPTEAD